MITHLLKCLQDRLIARQFKKEELKLLAQELRRISCNSGATIEPLIQNLGERALHTHEFDRNTSALERTGTGVFMIGSPLYPKQLLDLEDPPLLVFYRGNSDLLKERDRDQFISIVGSRHANGEGISISETIAQQMSDQRVTIVSGMALGIDGAAHRGAMSRGTGSTVAVLAHDVSICYPRFHQGLYEKIISSGGLVISEYFPGIQPLKHNFLERNRIIAALSKVTVVTQAKLRSGALVTARLAGEIGREIAAYPWSVSTAIGAGTNQLIQNGAHCIVCVEDLLNLYGIEEKNLGIGIGVGRDNLFLEQLTRSQNFAVELLNTYGQLYIDELQRTSQISDEELMQLEIEDVVVRDHSGHLRLRDSAFNSKQ